VRPTQRGWLKIGFEIGLRLCHYRSAASSPARDGPAYGVRHGLSHCTRYLIVGAGIHGLFHRLASGRGPAAIRPRQWPRHSGRRQVRYRSGASALRAESSATTTTNRHAPAHGAQRLRSGKATPRLSVSTPWLHADQPEVMHEQVASIARQQRNRLRVRLHRGREGVHGLHERPVRRLQAKGITSVLHEKKGGYANTAPRFMVWRARPRTKASGS